MGQPGCRASTRYMVAICLVVKRPNTKPLMHDIGKAQRRNRTACCGRSQCRERVATRSKDQAGECFVYYPQWGEAAANPVPIYYTQQPIILEAEANNDPATAQKNHHPLRDCWSISTTQGPRLLHFRSDQRRDALVRSALERLGQNTDPYLIVQRVVKNDKALNPSTKLLVSMNRKSESATANLFDISHADVVHKLVIPKTGTYRVVVRDLYFNQWQSTIVVSLVNSSPDTRL